MSRLRTHFRTMSLSVHSRPSCSHPQPMEEAARLPNPHRKASPTSYLQRRLSLELKEEAARLATPHRSSNPTAYFRQHCPSPEPTEEGARHLAPFRTTNSTARLLQSCLRPEPKEAAAPLANPPQPSNPTVRLQQHCPQPEPTGEAVRHLAPRRTMNSALNSTAQLQPSCLRSERMEEAAQLASHPYWTPSQPVLRKARQARAREQPQKLEAAPAGEL